MTGFVVHTSLIWFEGVSALNGVRFAPACDGDVFVDQINPRLDGCIRGWNLMDQGASGVKEVIQEKESKHCYVYVEKGSFFSGGGLALFNIDYSEFRSVTSHKYS